MNKLGVLVLSIFFSASTHSAIVDLVDRTLDTSTNLEWLDLSTTRGLSFNTVNEMISTGGSLEGWRYATLGEIEEFWAEFGVQPGPANSWQTENNGLFDVIAPLWGDLHCESYGGICATGEGYSKIISGNFTSDRQARVFVARMSDSAGNARSLEQDQFTLAGGSIGVGFGLADTGSALVRVSPVPLPASFFLFSSALLGLMLRLHISKLKDLPGLLRKPL